MAVEELPPGPDEAARKLAVAPPMVSNPENLVQPITQCLYFRCQLCN